MKNLPTIYPLRGPLLGNTLCGAYGIMLIMFLFINCLEFLFLKYMKTC